MKYRIKAYHYKNYSKYYPQQKFLWFWKNIEDILGCDIDFSSQKNAQKFLDDYIDKRNPKIEWIPYEV